MATERLEGRAAAYLERLCLEIPSRRVGSDGNREATTVFAERAAAFGLEVETPEFGCIDWTYGGAALTVGGSAFEVSASPYSLGCRVWALLVVGLRGTS